MPPPDLVRATQIERLRLAMLQATSELGYRATTVQDVLDRAGVSRPTFYEHFANKDDCFLAAFDAGAQRLKDDLAIAFERCGAPWRERLRCALEALLRFAAERPHTARALVVEARAGSAAAIRRRVELLDELARCLDARARELLPHPRPLSPRTAAGVVGGIEATLYGRLCEGEVPGAEPLLPALMYFVTVQYEGEEAAWGGGAPR